MAEALSDLRKTLYLDSEYILGHCALVNIYDQQDRPTDSTRHRNQATRLASKLAPDQLVPGSDSITAERLLAMLRVTVEPRSET